MIGAPSDTQPAARAATPVATRNNLRAFIDPAPSAPAVRGLIGALHGAMHERASTGCL
jgi:hypothetical protein